MRALVVIALALTFLAAGCGGGEEVSPRPETVEGTVPEETEPAPAAEGDPQAGREVFLNANPSCGSCHTFEAAGTNGTTGPNLNEALQGDSPEQIREQIVNPNSEITEGFQEGVMPQDYGQKLSDEELANLVAFLVENR